MTNYILSFLLVRVVLPGALLLSIAIRPFGLSLVYLLLFLLSPIPQVPDEKTWTGIRGKFLLLVAVISTFLLTVHMAWHSVLAGFQPYGSLLEYHNLVRRIGHNLGLVSYYYIDPLMAVHYLAPELVMTSASIAVYILVKKITTNEDNGKSKTRDNKYQAFPLLVSAGKYISLLLIMFSGILWPSVISGIYFLIFMGAATMWALDKLMEKAFAVVGRCVMAIMAVHSLILIAYQCNWATDFYPPEKQFARYFGLIKLVDLNETRTQSFAYEVTTSGQWTSLASPLVILVTYYILAIETRELFKPKLIRKTSSTKRWPSFRTNSTTRHAQDSTGSVVLVDDESEEEPESSILSDIISAVIELFQVLVRSSYIATTITMMAWSILYHSWLTFVFLMWANVVWLCQNQRRFMLRTSPVLVVYAMALLVAQYIYGMNLTEYELPSNITEVNLKQIGLGRADGESFVPLLIKSLFTCMFWVTLRQRVQEARAKRQASALADMAAPVQLTVSTAASEARKKEEHKSRLLAHVGDFLRAACARYWIYVVAVMLFVIGITGERMTIFRIIYMFLFLAFILLFQISWYWWRRLMYVFWIIVIIYSMINLILLYVYQFDNFSKIIEKFLFINEKLQHDLGLEPYDPADLFVKLLTPTLFLIITIMQVHYFHKDFMQLSNYSGTHTKDAESSRPSQGASTIKDDIPQLPEDERHASPDMSEAHGSDHEMSSLNTAQHRVMNKSFSRSYGATSRRASVAFRPWLGEKWKSFRAVAVRIFDCIFEYLDIHLTTIIFVALMLLCVFNVCAMHVPIMILSCLALTMSRKKQRFCVLLISTLISAYLMLKMVYQIDYIQHSNFAVNCSDTQNPINANNAEWLGFTKTSPDQKLVSILKGYISLIAIFTFNSLVIYRQQVHREKRGIHEDDSKLMFPDVNRKNADIDLVHCIKYLVNYGFYKFGVEITLMCMIGVIGSRMDMYSVIYAGWLLVVVSTKRRTQARLWTPFMVFLTIAVPLQYLLVVGFLPHFCVTYPWGGTDIQMKHVRNWAFLPYPSEPPHAVKLIFDYFLLLFATLQWRVFNIEEAYGDHYPGGSNSEDVGKDWETPTFENPVPDFLGFVGTWLDIFKRMVFLGMLWLTLAIMFMTGTNRVNLFSLGYLVGSFIFLWQGTDFYLLPKESILQWWSWLLRYNVSVVVIKSLLQIPGCIFSNTMKSHACWMVQLLGIGCVDKFAGGSISKFLKMDTTAIGLKPTCSVPQEDIGLAWDGVCFAFLILQRRLFLSYYFYRVIDESKATTVLASRGAELIEELRMKQMQLQEEQELNILEKIKVKMEKIKANQRKIQGVVAKEPRHHDHARECPPYKPPASHQKAIRSGDYYMFDDFDDTEEPIQEPAKEASDDEAPKEMGLGKTLARSPHIPTGEPGPSESEAAGGPPDEGETMIEDYAPTPEPETWFDKIQQYCEAAWAFISSFLVSLTRQLMKYSRDYRYVSRTLTLEKKVLKEKEGFGIGLREGSQMRWEPLPETMVVAGKRVSLLEEHDDSMFKHDRSILVHLIFAIWYAILAHTDIVCYIMVFINQIQSATILSIPLPLMVFLWGTLTIPRPTKTFWVTLIAYTEVIVLIKSMFQFEILPWNQNAIPANMPFTAPRIIGIERKNNYALYDLLLLLIIFLHRFMLKSLGLWKETTPEIELREDMEFTLEPEDTQKLVEGQGEEVGKKYLAAHDKTGPELAKVEGDLDWDTTSSADSPRVKTLALQEEEPGPSKPPDDHFKVNDDQEPIIAVTTTMDDPYSHFPGVIWLSLKRYLRPTVMFFKRMTAHGARVTADVYAYMFLCDFVNFLVVIFGFAAFGTHQGDGGVTAYLEENKVPIPFLVMLILQFVLIVIDRALYLRKYMLGKILFQYALIIGVHIWMFFILPFITERTFNSLSPPPLWYMMKCIYLLLSAYQIRCGYPRRIIGNFLCKSYRYLNMFSFRSFMAVPFVFELRTLMDWIWTDTSMTLMDWLKMEDIFANVFLLKCSRYVEDEFPAERGVKKSNFTKYLMGGTVLAFVIAIIWFPLVFFAFGNTVGLPNPPTDVTVKIRIGPFLPVYQMSAQSKDIELFSEADYVQLSNLFATDRTAQTFLSNYMYNDVAVVSLNANSTMKWDISPPELDRLEHEAESNNTLIVKFTFVITRISNNPQNPPTIEDSREVILPAYDKNGQRTSERIMLSNMLTNHTGPNDWLHVGLLFPKFLKVFNKGTAKPAYQLMLPAYPVDPSLPIDDKRLYRDVLMRLERDRDAMYWRVRENCTKDILQTYPHDNCNMLVLYTFNDKLFPETLNFISGGGIIGLYTTFVFLASRVIRGFFSGIYTKIMFDDLPNADRVLQLCLDIYLVREALELSLEEDLFAKLVFLYRSPETMIKWSRLREDVETQRALPPPSN